MNEQVIDKIAAYINELAAQLGVAAEYVYGILVWQMRVEGIVYSILLPITVAILVYLTIILKRKEEKVNIYDEDFYAFATIIVGIISAIAFVATVIILPQTILQALNPEYYAIKNILEMVSGK